jgi:uncharacterized membrane protein
MACLSVALAFITVAIDVRMTGGWLQSMSLTYTGGAEGASGVLETIAGSMMTIAGVVFSMTLVALTLASSQFGPRLLRNFMTDKSNQMVLGTFVATFLYCLLVLRTVRHAEENAFVPHLSITLGVLFAIVSIGILIYFIHHVSVSIQADEIVARVGAELIEGIERLFPEQIGLGNSGSGIDVGGAGIPASFDERARPVKASGDGYVQFIDSDALMHIATQENLLLRVANRPGHYVTAGISLVLVWPGDRVNEDLSKKVNKAIILGKQRTPAQDVEFAVSQLVEIAVRALSPGVNDPFTAIRCVDRLGSALFRLAGRAIPSPYRRDKQNQLRVITPPVTFPAFLDAAFDQIRQNARTNASVTIRLMDTIAVVAGSAQRPEDRAALLRQAKLIARGAREGLPEVEDCREVEDRMQEVSRVLKNPASSSILCS